MLHRKARCGKAHLDEYAIMRKKMHCAKVWSTSQKRLVWCGIL